MTPRKPRHPDGLMLIRATGEMTCQPHNRTGAPVFATRGCAACERAEAKAIAEGRTPRPYKTAEMRGQNVGIKAVRKSWTLSPKKFAATVAGRKRAKEMAVSPMRRE